MKTEAFKITYTTNYVKAIKIDNPGVVSFSAYSEDLTSVIAINLYVSNYGDKARAIPYETTPTISSNNEGHHYTLRDVDSTYLIVEVDFQTSVSGEVSFNLNFTPEQSFFLTKRTVGGGTGNGYFPMGW